MEEEAVVEEREVEREVEGEVEEEVSVVEREYLEELPDHVLECILEHLPDRELANLSCLSRSILRAANRLIGIKYRRLLERIDVELGRLEAEIEGLSLNQTGLYLRVLYFRSHVAFEFLKSEMCLMKSLGRGLLHSDQRAVMFARVTPDYQHLFLKAKQRNLPRLKVNDDLINDVIVASKLLVAKMKSHRLTRRIPLGTRILDMLDCILRKEFHVTVKFCFHRSFEFVVVDATYQFLPLNLYGPPSVGRWWGGEERERTVTGPDEAAAASIMDYLFNLIRLNNKSHLKEASYEREEEFNNRRPSVGALQHGPGVPLPPPLRWLNQQPAASDCTRDLQVKKSFHVGEESFWVKHKYKSKNFHGRLNMNRKGRIGV